LLVDVYQGTVGKDDLDWCQCYALGKGLEISLHNS
jgi:hypothetical protein